MNTTVTDNQIINSINGHSGKRTYLCTWSNGVQKRFSADSATDARKIATEWAVRFELSPTRNANPMLIAWDKEV